MQEEDQLSRLSKRHTRMAVVSLFLMAFLQGLHTFFFTLFFWPAVGFAALAIYYRIAAARQEKASTARWDHPDASPARGNAGRIVLFVIMAVVALLVIFSALLSSQRRSSTQTQQGQETDGVDSVTRDSSSAYQQAVNEFNKQNYRQSISMAQQALAGDANDNSLMLVLGDDYGALKQNDSAFVWYDRAYQNGARGAYLSHWLGYLHDEKGNLSRALEFYKDALRQDSSRAQIYDRLAELEPEKATWYKEKSSQWSVSK